MSDWKDLLFGNLVGFSAVLVIGFMLLMAVFFVVAFLRLTRAPHSDQGVATSDAGEGRLSADAATVDCGQKPLLRTRIASQQ